MRKVVLLSVVFWLIVFLLSSCRTKYIPIESVRERIEYCDRWLSDSAYIHDSVFVFMKGDTVYRDRWHTEYRDRKVYDTCYTSKTDTIRMPYPVDRAVEKSLSWWQKLFINTGKIALLAGLIILIVWSNKKLSWISKIIGFIKRLL